MPDARTASTDLTFFTNDEPSLSLYARFQQTLKEGKHFDTPDATVNRLAHAVQAERGKHRDRGG